MTGPAHFGGTRPDTSCPGAGRSGTSRSGASVSDGSLSDGPLSDVSLSGGSLAHGSLPDGSLPDASDAAPSEAGCPGGSERPGSWSADLARAGRRPAGAAVADGVGLTALMVAAARAIETYRPDALAQDPYAEHFVRAAPASEGWPVHPEDVKDGEANPLWGRLARYFGLRTRVLDDFLLRCVRAGTRQVVVLGAGLDSRAFRLEWPPGCTVFEVDTPDVLAFKHQVLGGLGAVPRAVRVPLAADLRTDWADALTGAGFTSDAPTAWLAEGLLLYLPPAAESALIRTVDRLSAPGSTLAFEVKRGAKTPEVRHSPVYAATKCQTGIDLLALFDAAPRPDSPADLRGLGWSATVRTPFHFSRRYGRGPLPERHDALATNRWTFAAKPRPRAAGV